MPGDPPHKGRIIVDKPRTGDQRFLDDLSQDPGVIEFLGRRFDAVDRRFDAVERRLDAVEQRLDGLERRLDGQEQRLTVLEINHEAMRDDIRAVADGLKGIIERIDRLEARFEEHHIETMAGFARTNLRLDRLEAA